MALSSFIIPLPPPSVHSSLIRYPIPIQNASNALITTLVLRVDMGVDSSEKNYVTSVRIASYMSERRAAHVIASPQRSSCAGPMSGRSRPRGTRRPGTNQSGV
ncbi:hypothetical protein EVAR_25466_1 [Eumeta japonica]|uniref:Uncharacterized protein n=1 Tax=Eumeta variegata TaxID=151549 RepID=A0A4C1VLW9_EUMVA|nr:hypothetical protein EVAR_25466_1 [Eumeta japonica]